MHDLADQFLARCIAGMRLAGEDKLHRHIRLGQQFDQSLRVLKQQVAAFIGRKPSCKTNRQRLRIKDFLGPAQLRVESTAPLKLSFEPPAGKPDHPLLAALMNPPQLLIRYLIQIVPDRFIHGLIRPAGAKVSFIE